jgi:hypothetical protein
MLNGWKMPSVYWLRLFGWLFLGIIIVGISYTYQFNAQISLFALYDPKDPTAV